MPRHNGEDPRFTAIFARALDWTVGHEGRIPWFAPHDMRFFRERTTNGVVIMGRRTWESLPKKPLPGRHNLVLSSTRPDTGVHWLKTKAELLDVARHSLFDGKEWFVIGGVETFRSLWDLIDRAIVTKINQHCDGDTKFPEELLDAFDIRVPGGVVMTSETTDTVWVYERELE